MTKKILTILLALSFVTQALEANNLSYKSENSLGSVLSKKDAQLSDDLYLNINFFTALSLVDDRFKKDYSFHEKSADQPMLTLSYRF